VNKIKSQRGNIWPGDDQDGLSMSLQSQGKLSQSPKQAERYIPKGKIDQVNN